MHVVFGRLAGYFLWSLKKRTYIDIEPQIGEASSYNPRTAIMTILSHFGDENSRTTTFAASKLICQFAGLRECFYIFHFSLVNTGNGLDSRFVTAKDFFHRAGDFAQGS